MMKGKLHTILLHCIGWIAFFSLPAIFIVSQSAAGSNAHFVIGEALNFLSFGVYIAIFYLHTYFLFPLLFFRKKWIPYFVSLILLLVIILYVRPFDRSMKHGRMGVNNMAGNQGRPPADSVGLHPPFANQGPPSMPPAGGNQQPPVNDGHFPPSPGGRQQPPPSSGHRHFLLPPGDSVQPAQSFEPPHNPGYRSQIKVDIISIALFILVIALSIALTLEKRWRIAVEQAARAETDKANAELSFLKAQINPHFLFNTLNNIYSLAITKSDHVADAIMKLSNIMRYVTDDVNEDFVSLEKELDSISDYISLQTLRLGKKANISFIVEGNTAGKIIAPLILMPFVENAFTHGISSAAASNIFVKLTATEKYIVFYTENNLFEKPRNVERTGIGTANTKKRLAQLYPGKYLLDIAPKNGLFTVHLVMYI